MKLHHTKILKILIVMMYLIAIITNISMATALNVKEEFTGTIDNTKVDISPVRKILATVLDVVRIVGIGIALIILIYIGIQIMIASPSEKANIQQYSINYVVGAGILIGASGILTIIRNFAINI